MTSYVRHRPVPSNVSTSHTVALLISLIAQYITPRPGAIIDHITGEALGTYEAMWTFTIGQGAKIRGMPQKMFVSGKDPKKNEIYVVPGS